ncbi:MAG: tRNA uridine-5-carboxymethylaminomethyl(34) synthesis GTPase MnmE [Desulfobacterales bacterium]
METIVALATPPGLGGIAILKMSGPKALSILWTLFNGKSENSPDSGSRERGWRLVHGWIQMPWTSEVVDEVIVSVMRGPFSYTREDIVEINTHGGPVVVRRILDLILQQGARLAEPGEFTRRAFLNGRIDLTQAEAVIDLIEAKSEAAASVFSRMVQGGLGEEIRKLLSGCIRVLAEIDGLLEFGEEIEEETDFSGISKVMERELISPLKRLIESSEEGRLLREGFRVVIVGAPNAGKSTLMNSLLRSERAIVTSIPGTTRDLIHEPILLGGIPVVLTDTAGWHANPDPVEQIGMQKGREALGEAQLVVMLVDGTLPVYPLSEGELDEIRTERELILVYNKRDLLEGSGPSIPEVLKSLPILSISAKYGYGIDDLKRLIVERGMDGSRRSMEPSALIPNARQRQSLASALTAVSAGRNGILDQLPLDLVAEEVRTAIRHLEQIIGKHPSADVLDELFNRFCIGK